MATVLGRRNFLRVMPVGMRPAAPVLNSVLFAVVSSLLVIPLYFWLIRRRLWENATT
jgi:hypothetical protein